MGKNVVLISAAGAVAPGQLLPTEARLQAVEASEQSRAADRAREQEEAQAAFQAAHGENFVAYKKVEPDSPVNFPHPDWKPHRPLRPGERM